MHPLISNKLAAAWLVRSQCGDGELCDPKILLHHSRVHACRWYVSHQYGTNQGYSIIDGRRKPTGRVSSGARGIVSHWVIPESRNVILVLAVIPIDLQVANIATLK